MINRFSLFRVCVCCILYSESPSPQQRRIPAVHHSRVRPLIRLVHISARRPELRVILYTYTY